MDADADEALRVQAHQHHPLPSKLVGESAKNDAAHHHPAEVGGGDEGGEEAAVAHQLPLRRDGPFVPLAELEGVPVLRGLVCQSVYKQRVGMAAGHGDDDI